MSFSTNFIIILCGVGAIGIIIAFYYIEKKLNPTSTIFDSIRHGFEIALILGVGIVVLMLFLRPPNTVTLPGGEKVKILDNSQYLKDIAAKLKKLDDLGKKINDLESAIRQKDTALTTTQIPEALKEKDIKKSVDRMNSNW